MAYEEYDYYNEPAGESKSLKESLYEILNGLRSEKNWRETGEAIGRVRDIVPNVTESLSRGGIGQAIGTSGDFRELRNTVNSYLPKSVRNMTQAAEFLANPYATAIQQTAPTTEKVLETVPRITDTYEGYKQHETLGEYIAPSLGYFGGKALKAGKDLPAGLSIMGPESKLWNKEMAFNAGKLEAKGATPDEILKKTGMVRGLDNQWRSEISDINSALKGEGDTFGTRHATVHPSNNRFTTPERRAEGVLVEDILHHPELLEAYPDLAKIKVEAHGSTRGEKGSYRQSKNTISIREDLSPEEARSTLLHELTHGVQGIEGMNRGANYKQLVQHFEKQKQYIMSQIENLNIVRNAAFRNNDMEKYRINTEKRDALTKQYLDMNPEEMGYEAYRNHAGEAEARMVQARRNLTPEELRKQFPYQYTGKEGTGLDINPDQAIVTTKQPGTINMPEQSIEPPTSKQDETGFHSALENAVIGIKQPKGTGDQFLKQLEKTPGVKTEELEVTGLKKYLQDNKFVTKQEVQDFIENNRLKLENKYLYKNAGEGNSYEDYRLEGGDVYHDQDYINGSAEDLLYVMKNDPDIYHAKQEELVKEYPELYEGYQSDPDVAARLNDHVDERLSQMAQDHAHENYYDNPIRHYYDEHGFEVYGNDDFGYSIKDPYGDFVDLGQHYDISDAETALRDYHHEAGLLSTDEEGAAKYADYVLPGSHENYREVLTTLPTDSYGLSREFDELNKFKRENPSEWTNHLQRELDSIEKKLNSRYESGHFDEPNILAHMRVNDRTINGKKTLMVEEIQSDWHQAGRRKGYQGTAEKDYDNYIKDLEKRYENEVFNTAVTEGLSEEKAKKLAGNVTKKMAEDPRKLAEYFGETEKQMAMNEARVNSRNAVPDAPFKKNWHEMMVKQALDMAAKGDYDAIAFTTGKQQADRYNLAKHIDKLVYNETTKSLFGYNDKGNVVVNKSDISPDQLADYVGQEVAQKMLDKEYEKVTTKGAEHYKIKRLENADLHIGGEGMKGFYDKILPDYINKYTKKWGMGMKKANLKSEIDSDKIIEGVEKMGFSVEEYRNLPSEKQLEILEKIKNEQPSGDQVHLIELSDAAKKDIKEKGQPMFAGIGALAGADYLAGSEEQNKLGIFKDLQKAKK